MANKKKTILQKFMSKDSTEPRIDDDGRSFAERTKVTGISPPPRGGTVSFAMQEVREREKKIAKIFKIVAFTSVPVVAGSVYWYLAHSTVAPATTKARPPVVAKVPDKVQVKAEPAKVVIQAAPIETLFEVDFFPQSVLSRNRALIRISMQPQSANQQPAVPRELNGLIYRREDIISLRRKIQTDESARHAAEAWYRDTQPFITAPAHTVASFRVTNPNQQPFVQAARSDLEHTKNLLMAWLVWADPRMEARLRSELLAWAVAYQPEGDVFSDAELDPLIEAYSNLAPRLPAPERAQIDEWLLLMADRQVNESIARGKNDDIWAAYHLKTVAYAAYTTGNVSLQNYVRTNFNDHVASVIRQNGATNTYEKYDSLTLHTFHVDELLKTARMLYRVGKFDGETVPTPNMPIGLAIDFAVTKFNSPTPDGIVEFGHVKDETALALQNAKTHIWLKRQFQSFDMVPFLEDAAFFRPSLVRTMGSIMGTGNAAYPTARTVALDAMTRETARFENGSLPAQVVIPAQAPQPRQPAQQPAQQPAPAVAPAKH